MKTVFHPSSQRGKANHGWLNSRHSFSFANYHDSSKMNFGLLRVLNDDVVSGGQGFGQHPHENMEIISIPLSGDLKHEDSMGNKTVIREGEIQVMSAGTGIFHSEYNANKEQAVEFLQIWIFPRSQDIPPRYDQTELNDLHLANKLHQVLSPNPSDQGVWIHQDAWFHIGTFNEGIETVYPIKKEGNGIYAFVLEGSFDINGQRLEKRDALGIWETLELSIHSQDLNSRLLLIDVPMAF
ncbi:MAG: pirin family protein [Schleiferiaceae bacterium]|jgi:redox-sensitive bicupin YhaK (pirin superfamily)|tara:strand:- start:980 stop:1696 length:717 start_codon:yes stop_codon:yes gene_type:complete